MTSILPSRVFSHLFVALLVIPILLGMISHSRGMVDRAAGGQHRPALVLSGTDAQKTWNKTVDVRTAGRRGSAGAASQTIASLPWAEGVEMPFAHRGLARNT